MTLYDEVEYPSRSFSQTHPERCATIGTLLGMSPAAPSSARVLEVGCGAGWNLVPMASALPDARFLGFDLAESAVEAAKRDAAALGLSNLQFECWNVMDLPPDLGEFDYIIAHGFYSWVPEPARLRLLEICRRHLAPQGLGFISFNASPYGRIRKMWREMMLFHAGLMGESDPQRKLAQGEDFLRTLRDQWVRKGPLKFHSKLLDTQMDAIRSGGGNWFFHDDFGPYFNLFSVSEFSQELESYGLQFAAEALFENLIPEVLPDAGESWIVREQNWDNMMFRGFHSTIVCRDGIKLERPAAAFQKVRYASPLKRVSPTVFRNEQTGSEAESDDDATLAVLERLAGAWPDSCSFEELQTTEATLRDLTIANVVEPRVSARNLPRFGGQVTSAPAIWAPARLQARRGKVLTNRLHGAIQIEQEPLRQFILGLDGTRPLLEFQHLFKNQQALLEQCDWLYRAALIQS